VSALSRRDQQGDLQFQKKPKKLPVGIPSIKISSPLMELDKGPNGDDEDGSTTVVSQYGGTASRSAAWYDCSRSERRSHAKSVRHTGGPSFCSSSETHSGPSRLSVSDSCAFGLAARLPKIPLLPAPTTRDAGRGLFWRGRKDIGRIPPRKYLPCRTSGRRTGSVGTSPLVFPGAGLMAEYGWNGGGDDGGRVCVAQHEPAISAGKKLT
jgi:hypothetical protein